ncbi:MAG: hypothetical protein HC798_03055 [Polaribacter sp.]|nr:hypothetical protein [Polaribacter sp.]
MYTFFTSFYIGSEEVKNSLAELYFVTDASATLKVIGYYTRIIRKNINIVAVDDFSFVKKLYSSGYSYSFGGTDQEIPLQPQGYGNLFLTNGSLVSLLGFNTSLVPTSDLPYEGKPLTIFNKTAVSITLKHFETASIPFLNKDSQDLILPPNESVTYLYSATGCSEFSRSFARLSSDANNSLTTGTDGGTFYQSEDTNITIVSSLPTVDIQLNKLYKLPDDSLQFYNGTTWVVVGGSGGGGGSEYPKEIVFINNGIIPTHTGTTSTALIRSNVVPANTIPLNCVINIEFLGTFNASSFPKKIFLNLNATNPNFGILLNEDNSGTNNNYFTLRKYRVTIPIINGVIINNLYANNSSDYLGLQSSLGINRTIDNNFNILCILSNASDSFLLRYVKIVISENND